MIVTPDYEGDLRAAVSVSSLLADTRCHAELLRIRVDLSKALSDSPEYAEIDKHVGKLDGQAERHLAIERIDRAVSAIRSRLDLPLEVKPLGSAMRVLPAGTPILVAGRPMTFSLPDTEKLRVEPGRLVATLGRGADRTQVEVISPAQVVTTVLPDRHQLAYPSRGWSAHVPSRQDDIMMIVEGDTSSKVELPGKDYAVVCAMDSGSNRTVLLESLGSSERSRVLVARTDDAGTWTFRSLTESRNFTAEQDPHTGMTDLIIYKHGPSWLYRFDSANGFDIPPPRKIEKADLESPCVDAGNSWWMIDDGPQSVARIGPDRAVTAKIDPTAYFIESCRGESALIIRREQGYDHLELCTGESCQPVLRSAAHLKIGTATFAGDGNWLYVTTASDVVGVWRQGEATPRFYRFRGSFKHVATLGGVTYLIVGHEGEYRLTPIPSSR